MRARINITHKNAHLLESDAFEIPVLPRVGDIIHVLEFNESWWLGVEFCETAKVTEVEFWDITRGEVFIQCTAEQLRIEAK